LSSGGEGSFDLEIEAFVYEGLHQSGHLFGGEEFEVLGRCGAVDRVDHNLPRAELTDYLHPTIQHFGTGGVKLIFLAAQHAGLQHKVALELLERCYHTGDVVARRGLVDAGNELVGGSVDFHYGVIHLGEGLKHFGQVHAGGIGEDGDLGRGRILVAEGDGVGNDGRELWIEGGFTVAGKGDGIDLDALLLEGFKLALKVVMNLSSSRKDGVGTAILVPSTFAVDAIKVAYFAFLWQEVDT